MMVRIGIESWQQQSIEMGICDCAWEYSEPAFIISDPAGTLERVELQPARRQSGLEGLDRIIGREKPGPRFRTVR